MSNTVVYDVHALHNINMCTAHHILLKEDELIYPPKIGLWVSSLKSSFNYLLLIFDYLLLKSLIQTKVTQEEDFFFQFEY